MRADVFTEHQINFLHCSEGSSRIFEFFETTGSERRVEIRWRQLFPFQFSDVYSEYCLPHCKKWNVELPFVQSFPAPLFIFPASFFVSDPLVSQNGGRTLLSTAQHEATRMMKKPSIIVLALTEAPQQKPSQ